MNDDDIDSFLAHYGVKGMKWGRQKVRDSTSGQTPSRKELRALDRKNRRADIDAARERVKSSGKTRAESYKKYYQEKKTVGKYAARKALNESLDKIYDDTTMASQIKNGRELLGAILMVAGGTMVVSALRR